jgi:hypothetical protein
MLDTLIDGFLDKIPGHPVHLVRARAKVHCRKSRFSGLTVASEVCDTTRDILFRTSRRRLVGIWIPLFCCLVLAGLFIAHFCRLLPPSS